MFIFWYRQTEIYHKLCPLCLCCSHLAAAQKRWYPAPFLFYDKHVAHGTCSATAVKPRTFDEKKNLLLKTLATRDDFWILQYLGFKNVLMKVHGRNVLYIYLFIYFFKTGTLNLGYGIKEIHYLRMLRKINNLKQNIFK